MQVSILAARVKDSVEVLVFHTVRINQHQPPDAEARKLFNDGATGSRTSDDRSGHLSKSSDSTCAEELRVSLHERRWPHYALRNPEMQVISRHHDGVQVLEAPIRKNGTSEHLSIGQ